MATMTLLDGRERAMHLSMIRYLAGELGRPEPEVDQVYQQEFRRLSEQARIKEFLYVLAGRRVKESFRVRRDI